MTLLLLMSVVAVWTTYARLVHETKQWRGKLETMQPPDHDMIECRAKPGLWPDELRWRIYLPKVAEYQLNFATREIIDGGFPPSSYSVRLNPGYHEITYLHTNLQPRFRVEVDNRPVIVVEEADDWVTTPNAVETNDPVYMMSASPRFPVPMQLLRSVISPGSGSIEPLPSLPRNGAVLWIESSVTAAPEAH